MEKTKSKTTTQTPERQAYDELNRKQQNAVAKKFRDYCECSRASFYNKLNGISRMRPWEKDKMHSLLKITEDKELLITQE